MTRFFIFRIDFDMTLLVHSLNFDAIIANESLLSHLLLNCKNSPTRFMVFQHYLTIHLELIEKILSRRKLVKIVIQHASNHRNGCPYTGVFIDLLDYFDVAVDFINFDYFFLGIHEQSLLGGINICLIIAVGTLNTVSFDS